MGMGAKEKMETLGIGIDVKVESGKGGFYSGYMIFIANYTHFPTHLLES
jgi:hypothetical protein